MYNVIIEPIPLGYIIFSKALARAKASSSKGHYVSYVKPEELEALGCKLFLSEDDTTGFAVTRTGELIAMFKHAESPHKNVLHHAIPLAKLYGAKRLECFEPLTPLYAQFGFRVLSSSPWNEEYKPNDWITDEKPNYYTMGV